MERKATINESIEIFGKYFFGPEELDPVWRKLGLLSPSEIPEIPFSVDLLRSKKDNYLLILGSGIRTDGGTMSLKTLRDIFGVDPSVSEPCFYNQDWYLKEQFANTCSLETKWFLVRREVYEASRGRNPEVLRDDCIFPSALLCAYAFFSTWFILGECLWKNDFLWCADHDSNGDRIYVGRYFDPSGISKNGFSIHRHLSIRSNYGCIDQL